MEVVYHLGIEALKIAGIKNPIELLKSNIENGSAFEKFIEMVVAHGGSLKSLEDFEIHKPKYKMKIIAENDGFITQMNTLELGQAVVHLGVGRQLPGDQLDYSAGIQFNKKIGQTILKGETLAEVFCSNQKKLEIGYSLVGNAYYLRKNSPKVLDLIY
tara:strand:- start:25 stop:498 length:474 start_codon:yes stop_codon:yes gene_type:complete